MQGDRDARIRERAYHIWVEEGRVHGEEHAHWHRAEREIAEEDARAQAQRAVSSGGRAARASSRSPASGEPAPPPARKPRARVTPKGDEPSVDADAPRARRRQREPSGAAC